MLECRLHNRSFPLLTTSRQEIQRSGAVQDGQVSDLTELVCFSKCLGQFYSKDVVLCMRQPVYSLSTREGLKNLQIKLNFSRLRGFSSGKFAGGSMVGIHYACLICKKLSLVLHSIKGTEKVTGWGREKCL